MTTRPSLLRPATLDPATPATEYSHVRAAAYGAACLMLWFVLDLIARAHGMHTTASTDLVEAFACGVAWEYGRRAQARRAAAGSRA